VKMDGVMIAQHNPSDGILFNIDRAGVYTFHGNITKATGTFAATAFSIGHLASGVSKLKVGGRLQVDNPAYTIARAGVWDIDFSEATRTTAVAGAVVGGFSQMMTPTAERQRLARLPAAAIDETLDRRLAATITITLQVSGRLNVLGSVFIPAGQPVSSITCVSGSTAMVGPTHQWFGLVRVSDLSILGTTVDDTSTAWATNATKTLAMSSTYTPAADTLAYVVLLITAGTMPTVTGYPGSTILTGITPKLVGSSSKTGLTDPASFTDAGTITALGTNQGYAYIA
jgi:hypothetical protein